ncbi:hypothetical protein FKM82_011468 [Ascaphus truei]
MFSWQSAHLHICSALPHAFLASVCLVKPCNKPKCTFYNVSAFYPPAACSASRCYRGQCFSTKGKTETSLGRLFIFCFFFQIA